MSHARRYAWTLCVVPLYVSPCFTRAQVPVPANSAMVVRSDLRNLVVAQEAFYANHGHYTAFVDSLNYQTSGGVTVTVQTASERGWSGFGRYRGAEFTCFIYVGATNKARPGAAEGTPVCEGVPTGEAMSADSVQRRMMSNVYEALISALARPDVADRLAAFTRNYYEALVRHGFTADEALRIVESVGIPSLR